jgi:hypothetical protein
MCMTAVLRPQNPDTFSFTFRGQLLWHKIGEL